MSSESPKPETPLEDLYVQYYRRFINVAARYVRDTVVAEDLVSDSFMAFFEEEPRLAADVNKPAYILTIVKNKCLNHLNARLRHLQIEKDIHTTRQRLIQADIRSLAASDPSSLLTQEIMDILEQAIDRMPTLTRRVFVSSRYDEKSYKEIARELNISFTHVNFEMRRALKVLRDEFKDYIPILFIVLLSSIIIY